MRLRRVVVGALETNCWIVSDGDAALVVDPGDDPGGILAAADGLDVTAIVLTHAHFDHVLAVPALVDAWQAPVLAHHDEAPVWPHELDTARRTGHWDAGTAPPVPVSEAPSWDGAFTPIADGATLHVGPIDVHVLHTPGHTPGGLSLLVDGHVLTGDTLFPGGPGLTGPPLSDFPTIIASVRRLLALPPDTRVHPGHGPDTAVAAERPHLHEWVTRGW